MIKKFISKDAELKLKYKYYALIKKIVIAVLILTLIILWLR